MDDFSKQIAAWAAAQQRALDQTVRQSVIELHQRIVRRVTAMDAVSSGQYRASFVYGAGAPSAEVGPKGSPDAPSPPPGPPKPPAQAAGVDHYITNNLGYARLVEFGTGATRARPAVRESAAEFPQIVAEAWKEAQKG